MTDKIDNILILIGKKLGDHHKEIVREPLPPDLSTLLAELKERELALSQERLESRSPQPIATDEALGG